MALYFVPSRPRFLRRKRGFFDSVLNDIERMESAITPMLNAVSQKEKDSAGKLNKPEELSVDLDGRVLKVRGKQEIKEENGYAMRTFARQWMLPEDVDVEQFKSSLTEDGHLDLEAPKITKKAPTTRSIQIEKAPRAVTGKENSKQ